MENFYENAKFEANNYFAAEGDGYGSELYGQGGNQDGVVPFGENLYGNGNGGRIEQSLPAIIIAENTGTATDSNIELFDAASKGFGATPEITGDNSDVVLTTDMPNTSYAQFIRGMLTGETYIFSHLRIKTLDAPTDSLKNSAPDASITYTAKTNLGRSETLPIYPEESSIQNIEYIRDVDQKFIVNANTSFKIASLTAGTKVSYKFYPQRVGSQTDQLLGRQARDMSFVNPNKLAW